MGTCSVDGCGEKALAEARDEAKPYDSDELFGRLLDILLK